MTTAAVGIHTHPSKKLGARPEDTSRPKVPVGRFLLNRDEQGNALPVYPPSDTIPELGYPMDHNDQAGDCVVAGVDHALEIIGKLLTGAYAEPSDSELLRRYQTQNPGFKSWADSGGPNDNGMVIADFLDWCIREGLIIAYGRIDTSNKAEVEAAIYVGLAVITGETLQVAQQNGTVWDYVPGSPDWGGHCTVWNGYWPPPVVTWGSDAYKMTDAFIAHRVSEAYLILTQAHIDHPSFRNNFDLAGFAAAISSITHGKVIVPTQPTPTPAPPPGPGASFPVAADVAARIAAAAHRAGLSDADWLDQRLRHYFHMTK